MRKYKLKYKLGLALLSGVIFFTLAEISLGILNLNFPVRQRYRFHPSFFVDPQASEGKFLKDPVLFWRLNPDFPFLPNEINSKGFRDREFGLKKEQGAYRIISLGDSITYGVPEKLVRMEDTYPERLEILLNSHFPERKFEVINAGVPGYSSYQGLMYLKELLKYEPDLITIYFGNNDGAPAVYYSDREQHSQPLWIIKLQNWLINFRLYRLLCSLIIPLKKADILDSKNSKPRVSYKEHIENVNEMIKIAKQYNIKIVYITPLVYMEKRIQPVYEPFPLDIPKVDIVKRLQQDNENLEDLFFDNCHYTPKGHQIVGEEIYKLLVNEGIIETR